MASSWAGGARITKLRELVMSEYGSLCHLCLRPIETLPEYSIDHVVSRSNGGTDDIENLRPAHLSCNSSRGDRSIEAFRANHTDATNWFYALTA